MENKMTGKEIAAIAAKYYWRNGGDYEYVGIRTQEVSFALGKIEHCSKVWVDGDVTEEELNGISTTNHLSDCVEAHGNGYYLGAYVAIIGGNRAEYGEDGGELIIEEAEVLEIIR